MLLFGRIGVGSEGRAFGGLNGLLPHGIVDDVGAFGGDFGANDLSSTIHPNVNYDSAFFAVITIGVVEALCTTTTKVITCSVAFASVAVVLLDASQSIGFALVARLTSNAFRTTCLRVVAAFEQSFVVDIWFGFFDGLFLWQ